MRSPGVHQEEQIRAVEAPSVGLATWRPVVCRRPGFRFPLVARAAVPAAAAVPVAREGASTSSYSDADEPQNGVGKQGQAREPEP